MIFLAADFHFVLNLTLSAHWKMCIDDSYTLELTV